MIAMYQSHVYKEYLPKIIGEQKMKEFDLWSTNERKSKALFI